MFPQHTDVFLLACGASEQDEMTELIAAATAFLLVSGCSYSFLYPVIKDVSLCLT